MSAESPGMAYRVFSLLLLPFWIAHAYFHGRKQSQPDYLKQRCWGRKLQQENPVIWVHAASVGEVMAVVPLVKALLADGEKLLLTSFTASGLQTIQRVFPGQPGSTVIPVDFLLFCRQFVHQHNIKLCLLMETELWPELLFQTAKKGIPIVQVNARLSKKSTEAPIFIRYLLRRALANIQLHLARNELDRQLLIGLGAESQRVKVIGNLKSRIDSEQSHEKLINRDYILLASTHDGEEALFLEHRKPIKELLVIAPRHPKRSEEIQKILSTGNIKYAVRSKKDAIAPDTQVYLADTLGELKALMAHAILVVMGGSFDQTGGHNLIEPASLGCAIITGPSDSNIVDDIQQLGDGVLQVDNMETCWSKIEFLINNPKTAQTMGEIARQNISQHENVLAHYLKEIRDYF